MSELTEAERVADRIRELAAHLNANIRKASDLGLRVEVDHFGTQEMGQRWPVPFVVVDVTAPVR